MKKLFQLALVLDNLSRIPRAGGALFSGIATASGDSVAEHSYKTMWLIFLFAETAKEKGIDVDMEKMLKYTIVHDWSESVLLDIPSGSPSYRSYFEDVDIRKTVKSAEAKALKSMAEFVRDDVNINVDTLKLEGVEHQIFRLADQTALMIEILQWKYHGMKYDWFDYIWSNTMGLCRKYIAEELEFFGDFLDELQEAYDKGSRPANPFLTKPEFQTFKK